ncbi:hypothetical protein IE077_002086 [Cardiosporidium cionae]|uniref:SPEF2 C-terminal domain-containing protein n=1 Tax=Cardiosporidium cionae TaxID=476202 RepID=A0ABQ7JBL4_9APIC|nr:hypothetical protein IE077_002086 [Cardiosporidium cionae]|eukprot:KAF8821383.1 hypothetical protein IE077_002086 [Cardiosporidium cionae]
MDKMMLEKELHVESEKQRHDNFQKKALRKSKAEVHCQSIADQILDIVSMEIYFKEACDSDVTPDIWDGWMRHFRMGLTSYKLIKSYLYEPNWTSVSCINSNNSLFQHDYSSEGITKAYMRDYSNFPPSSGFVCFQCALQFSVILVEYPLRAKLRHQLEFISTIELQRYLNGLDEWAGNDENLIEHEKGPKREDSGFYDKNTQECKNAMAYVSFSGCCMTSDAISKDHFPVAGSTTNELEEVHLRHRKIISQLGTDALYSLRSGKTVNNITYAALIAERIRFLFSSNIEKQPLAGVVLLGFPCEISQYASLHKEVVGYSDECWERLTKLKEEKIISSLFAPIELEKYQLHSHLTKVRENCGFPRAKQPNRKKLMEKNKDEYGGTIVPRHISVVKTDCADNLEGLRNLFSDAEMNCNRVYTQLMQAVATLSKSSLAELITMWKSIQTSYTNEMKQLIITVFLKKDKILKDACNIKKAFVRLLDTNKPQGQLLATFVEDFNHFQLTNSKEMNQELLKVMIFTYKNYERKICLQKKGMLNIIMYFRYGETIQFLHTISKQAYSNANNDDSLRLTGLQTYPPGSLNLEKQQLETVKFKENSGNSLEALQLYIERVCDQAKATIAPQKDLMSAPAHIDRAPHIRVTDGGKRFTLDTGNASTECSISGNCAFPLYDIPQCCNEVQCHCQLTIKKIRSWAMLKVNEMRNLSAELDCTLERWIGSSMIASNELLRKLDNVIRLHIETGMQLCLQLDDFGNDGVKEYTASWSAWRHYKNSSIRRHSWLLPIPFLQDLLKYIKTVAHNAIISSIKLKNILQRRISSWKSFGTPELPDKWNHCPYSSLNTLVDTFDLGNGFVDPLEFLLSLVFGETYWPGVKQLNELKMTFLEYLNVSQDNFPQKISVSREQFLEISMQNLLFSTVSTNENGEEFINRLSDNSEEGESNAFFEAKCLLFEIFISFPPSNVAHSHSLQCEDAIASPNSSQTKVANDIDNMPLDIRRFFSYLSLSASPLLGLEKYLSLSMGYDPSPTLNSEFSRISPVQSSQHIGLDHLYNALTMHDTRPPSILKMVREEVLPLRDFKELMLSDETSGIKNESPLTRHGLRSFQNDFVRGSSDEEFQLVEVHAFLSSHACTQILKLLSWLYAIKPYCTILKYDNTL